MPDRPLYAGKSFPMPSNRPFYGGPAASAAAWMNAKATEGYVMASVTSSENSVHVLMAHAAGLASQAQGIVDGLR